MRGKQFAPIHARFASRMADPHTDPEANYSEKKDRPGQTDWRKTKTYTAQCPCAFTHEWPFLRTTLAACGEEIASTSEWKQVTDQ